MQKVLKNNALMAIRISKAYLWILPAVILSVVFRFYPFFNGFVLSLQNWDGVNDPVFVGLQNFVEILTQDTMFWKSLTNNMIFALFTVAGKVAIAMFLAILLNQKIRGLTLYRTVLFVPVVMSFVVVGLLFGWILNYNFGLLNSILRSLGLDILAQDWLGDPKIALYSIIAVDIWKWYGFHMVIFLAALQSIPKDLYESAEIDGASGWKSFCRITLPLLAPITAVNIAISLQGGFNVFDLIYVLTEGGPFNSTNVVALHVYVRGFKYYRMGYATAMSYMLFFIIIIITGIQLKIMNKDKTK